MSLVKRNCPAGGTQHAARRNRAGVAARMALAGALMLGVAACGGQVVQHGYIANDTALDQIQIGSSREQVQIIMGTPTMTGAVESDSYYYISEVRKRTLFLAPETIDRRVLAVYFNDDGRVSRIANYGLKDGKVFDFISRTTPTQGSERDVLASLLGVIGNISPF